MSCDVTPPSVRGERLERGIRLPKVSFRFLYQVTSKRGEIGATKRLSDRRARVPPRNKQESTLNCPTTAAAPPEGLKRPAKLCLPQRLFGL